ncbi:TetR/AcrR family transcriptional regulator [Shewanella sp. 1CM18E]|uniref:TetR/AcrR family transcriptional regulator n=1 Tax=Shewanella sp. 1CM18E TaxID=2929169 RepID=UPI0020BDB5FE|nr:TetR/AcrR family transcriptional regulator [Shewanella sp. 1CM18E]MCK8046010.1 TetR/AcrR family transcriptional regulator [Shewanella sp. 1CM18E]
MARNTPKKTEQDNVRASLIRAAYRCFTAADYDKVSIRQIAEVAGVNMAMIRYYFGNKLGLFEAMVTEYIKPIHRRAKALQQSHDKPTVADIVAEFYQTMIPNPEFPRFLFQLMSSEHSVEAKGVIYKLFQPIAELTPMPQQLLEGWGELDPQLLKMSLLSLMIFPFVMPPPMAKLHGYQLNEEFYQQLAKHNIALLEHGMSGGKR